MLSGLPLATHTEEQVLLQLKKHVLLVKIRVHSTGLIWAPLRGVLHLFMWGSEIIEDLCHLKKSAGVPQFLHLVQSSVADLEDPNTCHSFAQVLVDVLS